MTSKASADRIARLKRDFEGKIIQSIDAACLNVVHFVFADGSRASIGADDFYFGIPVVGAESWDGDTQKSTS